MNKLDAMALFVRVVDAGCVTPDQELAAVQGDRVDTDPRAGAGVGRQTVAPNHALVQRDTRRRAYYEHCLRILADVHAPDESLARSRQSPSGRLWVYAPSGLASAILIPAIPHFFRRYPDISLELGCRDRPAALIEEGVDCGRAAAYSTIPA